MGTYRRSNQDLIDTIKRLKNLDISVCLVTDKEIPRELLWELASSPQNVLQINFCMIQKPINSDWVIEMIHLAETCGIKCNLILFPILPSLVTTVDIIKIIDGIRNCGHCTVYLKFGELKLNSFKCLEGNLLLSKKVIPIKYLDKLNGYLWRCNSLYTEEFFQTVKFYTDNSNMLLYSI